MLTKPATACVQAPARQCSPTPKMLTLTHSQQHVRASRCVQACVPACEHQRPRGCGRGGRPERRTIPPGSVFALSTRGGACMLQHDPPAQQTSHVGKEAACRELPGCGYASEEKHQVQLQAAFTPSQQHVVVRLLWSVCMQCVCRHLLGPVVDRPALTPPSCRPAPLQAQAGQGGTACSKGRAGAGVARTCHVLPSIWSVLWSLGY